MVPAGSAVEALAELCVCTFFMNLCVDSDFSSWQLVTSTYWAVRLDRGVFRARALDIVVLSEGSIAARVLAVRRLEHPSRGFCTDAFCSDLLCPCVVFTTCT